MPRIAIVDIDGVISNCDHRKHFAYEDGVKKKKDHPDWEAFSDACDLDSPIEAGIRLVEALSHEHLIVFMTGRSGSCRDKTIAWMEKHVYGRLWVCRSLFLDEEPSLLLMRPIGNHKPAQVLKREFVEDLLKGEIGQPALFIDDDIENVEAVLALGVPCLHFRAPTVA